MSEYLFPRAFVEGEEGKEYACVKGDEVIFTRERKEGCFGKVPIEIIFDKVIDLLEGEVKRSFIIHDPKENRAILVPKGTKVTLQESHYQRVFYSVREGEELKEGEKIGHSITGKGESRTLRSPIDGVVVLVHQELYGKADKYILVMADKDSVKFLKIKGGS